MPRCLLAGMRKPHMIEIIRCAPANNTIFPLPRLISPAAFERGERAVERLVGEPELGGQILQRAGELDGAAIGAGIEREKVADPFARGADVALLDDGCAGSSPGGRASR